MYSRMPPAAPQQQQQEQQQSASLLEVPGLRPLLLAVLQCLAAADDQRSLFSAARAHSRLHQAAVAALSSVKVHGIQQQQQLDGVLLYLAKHGQHVSSLSLGGAEGGSLMHLRQLPTTLQLHSLELHSLELKLLPGEGWQGVLSYDGLSALRQLRLKGCTLLDGDVELDAALAQLPGLEHLSIDDVLSKAFHPTLTARDWCVPSSVYQQIQQMQQLTSLELANIVFNDGASLQPLQPLHALTRLADLRLHHKGLWLGGSITGSMLSGMSHLTHLEVSRCGRVEPSALAGKPQLQHLELVSCTGQSRAAGAVELLLQLQSLQQLTYLCCQGLVWPDAEADADSESSLAPAAFSALTASSRLQHLDISSCTLPAAVWPHLFPASGRQLPRLTSLNISGVRQAAGGCVAVPDCSCLVACCPGLQSLDMMKLHCPAEQLASLAALSGLRTLRCGSDYRLAKYRQAWALAGLGTSDPNDVPDVADSKLLLQASQLRQLTQLEYSGRLNGAITSLTLSAQDPVGEPVWRQVLRLHLSNEDPVVAQEAAAALGAE